MSLIEIPDDMIKKAKEIPTHYGTVSISETVVQPHETVVSILEDEDLKHLFSYLIYLNDRNSIGFREYLVTLKMYNMDDTHPAIVSAEEMLSNLNEEQMHVSTVFWQVLLNYIGQKGRNIEIYIKQNWQIVLISKPPEVGH